jgi:hypothetical protein
MTYCRFKSSGFVAFEIIKSEVRRWGEVIRANHIMAE